MSDLVKVNVRKTQCKGDIALQSSTKEVRIIIIMIAVVTMFYIKYPDYDSSLSLFY